MTSKDEEELPEEAWEPSEFPAAEDEETIYPDFDGIRTSAPWRLADYYGQGALSEENLATLAKSFDLPQPILRTLSIDIGNGLDTDSIAKLAAVNRDVAIARADKALKDCARLAKRVEQDLAKMSRHFSSLSDGFVSNGKQQGVLASAQHKTDDVRKAAIGLHDAIDRAIRLPGSAADMSPRDKRGIPDRYRLEVVKSCCHAWNDAGRPVTVTTSPERTTEQRGGALIEFIQVVTMMVTEPPTPLKGETLRKDIADWKPEEWVPEHTWIDYKDE